MTLQKVQTEFDRGQRRQARALRYKFPFVVAVTGHRDLHPDDLEEVRQQVRTPLQVILVSVADRPIYCCATERMSIGVGFEFCKRSLDCNSSGAWPPHWLSPFSRQSRPPSN